MHTHAVAEGLANSLWHENEQLGSQWAPYRASRRPSVQPRLALASQATPRCQNFLCAKHLIFAGGGENGKLGPSQKPQKSIPQAFNFFMASGKSLDDYI